MLQLLIGSPNFQRVVPHCLKGNQFSAIEHEMYRGKRDTMQNISYSISFSSTFHDISQKFGFTFGLIQYILVPVTALG